MKKIFRFISFFEGVSYLLLLFIAVPIKYYFGYELYVKMLGMPHGILFISYVFFSFLLKKQMNWSFKTMIIVLLGSVIPFGTFYIDKEYLRNSE